MAALGLITLGNVVVRYLTNYSFAFTEEYSIALMVVVALLGGSIAAARNHHMRITWFVDNMPRGPALSNTVAMLATVVMFGLLIALGGKLVWDEYRFEVTSPGLGEPQWIYTATLPLFSILVVIRAVAVGHGAQEPVAHRETAPPPAGRSEPWSRPRCS